MKTHEALNTFLNDPKSGITKKSSRANYSCELMKLSQHRDLDSFTEQELIDVCYTTLAKGPRKGKRPADGTIYARRKVFEGFFGYCQFMGWIKEDPSRHMKRYLGGRGQAVIQHNWLTQAEVEKVLGAVDMDSMSGPRDDIFMRLGFTAGLRVSELANLRWKDVNFDRKEISLVGKGDKIAVVHISKTTFLHLVDWHGQCAGEIGRRPHNEMVIPRFESVSKGVDETGNWLPQRTTRTDWAGSPLTNNTLGKVCQKYSEITGLVFKPHDMRRTFAGLMMEKVDIYQVSKAMRHSDVSTTERYLQTRPDAAAQAVREAGLDF